MNQALFVPFVVVDLTRKMENKISGFQNKLTAEKKKGSQKVKEGNSRIPFVGRGFPLTNKKKKTLLPL